ncbi:MAG: tryptophan-rich sensory protein [Erysipelotrichales bacterium]|nr:tryptophan-rich sensory protein [Erysipelotrichales bacterium]
MKKLNLNLDLAFNLLFPLFVSFVISMTLPNFSTYYNSLITLVRVPAIVFPIVWTILYILIGFVGYKLSQNSDEKGEKIYYTQLLINFLWTPVFFGFKSPIGGLVLIVILLGLVIWLFFYVKNGYGNFAYILLPYIIWLLFATFLNLSIVILN